MIVLDNVIFQPHLIPDIILSLDMIIQDDMESLNMKLAIKLAESRDDASKTVAELRNRLHETVSADTHIKQNISFTVS